MRGVKQDSAALLSHRLSRIHPRVFSPHFQRFHNIYKKNEGDTITPNEPRHGCFLSVVCVWSVFAFSDAHSPVLCPSAYMNVASLLPLLLLLSLFPSSLLFCVRHHSLCYSVHLQGAYKRCNTHTHTHPYARTHSQYGCALPSTDARRITVREITVNICSMNMMRLAERRRGEERRIIYSVTSPCVAPSLILFPPSLYTSLPISHSLSSSTSLFLCDHPSLPLSVCLC